MNIGASYYPTHRPKEQWKHDVTLMKECGISLIRFGDFSWSDLEPEMDRFDFSLYAEFLHLLQEFPVNVLLIPPVRCAPAWMVEQHPELLIHADGNYQEAFGTRYTFCINHPFFLERAQLLVEKFAKALSGFDAIVGWHLDNELGDDNICHCKHCKAQFQQWCRERYENIDALNRAWGLNFWSLNFNHFGQIPTPTRSKASPNPAHYVDWRRFRSDSTIKLTRMIIDGITPYVKEGQYVTTNHQMLQQSLTDYYQLAELLDVSGTNYYPEYNSEESFADAMVLTNTRSYKGKKFQVHELRNGTHMIPGRHHITPAPGDIERLTLHCLANGATDVLFFRWDACPYGSEQSHGTLQGYNGKPKRAYYEVQNTIQKLRKLGGEESIETIVNETSIQSEVAMLHDFHTRWAMEQESSIWLGEIGLYKQQSMTVHEGLKKAHINFDVCSRYDDWSRYKVVIITFLQAVDAALDQKIAEFVTNGGTVLLHPLCATKDYHLSIYPERISPEIHRLMKSDISEFASLDSRSGFCEFQWNQKQYKGYQFIDLAEYDRNDSDYTVLSTHQSDWFAGAPALSRISNERGALYHLSTFADAEFYTDFINYLVEEGAISTIIPGKHAACFEIVEHVTNQQQRYIFVINHSRESQDLELDTEYYDVYNHEELRGRASLDAKSTSILKRI